MEHACRHVRLVAISLLVAVLSACANEALLLPLNWREQDTHVVTTTHLAYGTDARQTLDLYRPQGAQQAPVMVFWYGGSWQQGSKDYYRFVGQSLARRGFVAILPDYRLAPAHPFPAFVEDAASTVRWARDHAEEFGGDPNRIYISGHSAGGHNALMLALDPRHERMPAPVSDRILDGPPDLLARRLDERLILDVHLSHGCLPF